METQKNLRIRKYWIVFILFFSSINILFAQQVIKFKNGIGYGVNIIYQSKDTIKYQMIADPSVTFTVSMDQIESISPIVPNQNQQPLRHQKYIFKMDEGIGKPYTIKLISVNDSSIYFLKTQEGGQKENIYLWYNKINEITVYRKNHIGAYVGLAAGFLGGVIFTFSTPKTNYYTDWLSGAPMHSTVYPNWWTMFAGAAAGAVIGAVIESIVKKKIKMNIHKNHEEYLKYKPLLDAYLYPKDRKN